MTTDALIVLFFMFAIEAPYAFDVDVFRRYALASACLSLATPQSSLCAASWKTIREQPLETFYKDGQLLSLLLLFFQL